MLWLIMIFCVPFMLFVFLFQFGCIIYAPFAGWTSAKYARNHPGLSVWNYALAGAGSSALLLGPWLYLRAKMRNEALSFDAIKKGYSWLYLFWAGVIFSNTVIIIVFFGVARVGGTFENLSLLAPAIIPLVAGVPLWMISRATLSRNLSIEWDRMANKRVDILPNSDLLLPFVYTSANIMVLPIMYKFLESINSLMLYYG